MESGLNIATKVGDGQAGVIDWSGFHNTLNQIYQRDIDNHKAASLAYDRSAMEVNKMADGIRAEDLEDFKGAAEAYKQASLMLMNPKIKRDAQESAKWQRAKDEAFFTSMQVANESKKEALRQHELNAKYLKSNGADFNENYLEIADKVKGLSTKAIKQNRLDNEATYILPKDPNTEAQIFEGILGTKNKTKLSSNIQKDGMQKEYKIQVPSGVKAIKQNDGTYKYDYSSIATDAAKYLLNNPKYHKQVIGEFNNQFPQEKYKIMLEAQSLQPDFEVKNDPEHYFAAKMIVKAKREISEEEGKETPIKPTFAEQTKVAKEKATTQFNRSLEKMGYGASLREKVATKGVTPEAVKNETDAIFERAKKEGKEVDVNGKKMYLTSEYEEENKKHPVKVSSDAKGDIVKPAPLVAVDEDGIIHQLQSKEYKGVKSLVEVGTGISQEKVFDRVAHTMLTNKGITPPKDTQKDNIPTYSKDKLKSKGWTDEQIEKAVKAKKIKVQ
jgi:hypothetical protein